MKECNTQVILLVINGIPVNDAISVNLRAHWSVHPSATSLSCRITKVTGYRNVIVIPPACEQLTFQSRLNSITWIADYFVCQRLSSRVHAVHGQWLARWMFIQITLMHMETKIFVLTENSDRYMHQRLYPNQTTFIFIYLLWYISIYGTSFVSLT